MPPENVRIYATSNRRHLLPEYMKDNEQTQVVNRELHHGDVVEEKISLSDRFGLGLSFYPINEAQYFEIVDHLFGAVEDREQLHVRARRFSMEKGVRSGRTAGRQASGSAPSISEIATPKRGSSVWMM